MRYLDTRWLWPLLIVAACGGSSGGGAADENPDPDEPVVAQRIALDGDPNGLFWDAASGTLYIADDNNNRILSWTEENGVALAAELPEAPPDGPGLGQVVKTADGTLVATRFGHGTDGAVVFAKPDGTSGVVPNLDPVRRRLGLTIAPDGTLYDTFFVSLNGVKNGSIARLDLSGTETEVVTGFQKPVGVVAVGDDLVVSDQDRDTVFRTPPSDGATLEVLAQLEGPDLLCVGPDGTFYSGGKQGSVRQIQGGGQFSEVMGDFQEVRGVAYDAKRRRLFVADHDGTEGDGVNHALHILPVD
ncbi:SMP-30/gluconolactonase/LRE family protein [Chondromyces apiculatus]|uniref:SMP-30/Gluconolactonase/LRE-like region domain-containing protein n=1 Tax=Chondromyces apiculatus DSM 436 TaxID=1192034 RepID=A0A017T5W0_9BACT|nr:hypothetical protein [Chondromyces apiculatus]EYF04643.1 Hypothetical protein CAP_4319 [Chondromyces apiculatus DSM 436]